MKINFKLIFLMYFFTYFSIFSGEKWWNNEFPYRIKFELIEQSGIERNGEPVVIKGNQFIKSIEGSGINLRDIKTSSIRIVSFYDGNFKEIPVQVDEKDDRNFILETPNGFLDPEDEIIFLVSVKKNSSNTFWLYFDIKGKTSRVYDTDLKINEPSEFCLNDSFNETARHSADFWANNSFYGVGVNIKGPKGLIFSRVKNTILLNGVITKYGVKGHTQFISDQPNRGISLIKFGDIPLYSVIEGWQGFIYYGPVRASIIITNDKVNYKGDKYFIVRNFHIYSYSKILEIEDIFLKETSLYQNYEKSNLQNPIIAYSNVARLLKGPMYWFDEIKGKLESGYQTGWKTKPKEIIAPGIAVLDEEEKFLTAQDKAGFGIVVDYDRVVENIRFGCHALPNSGGDQPYGGFCVEYKYKTNFEENKKMDKCKQWLIALTPGDTIESFINIVNSFQDKLEKGVKIGKLEILTK